MKRLKEDHLLISAGVNQYVFIHATVMEYLAARFVAEKMADPGYLESLFKDCVLPGDIAGKGRAFLGSEILPIAVGSGIETGARLMGAIYECIRESGDKERVELLYRLALKCLAEYESYIDRQYRRKRLGFLHREMEAEIERRRLSVDWIYDYLKGIVLSCDKEMLNVWIETFKNLSKLTRPYFLETVVSYDLVTAVDLDSDSGSDSETVGLRLELLKGAVDGELLERWLEKHGKEKETLWELNADVNLTTFDSKGYHPEDKNFGYYRGRMGKELTGFLGSPNLKHESAVTCVAYSPDGKYILSGSLDSTVKLWDVSGGREIRAFKGHTNSVNSVCFSGDGRHILSCSDDNTVKLWDLQSGQCIKTLQPWWTPLDIKEIPGQPGRIATANANGTVTFFDLGEWI